MTGRWVKKGRLEGFRHPKGTRGSGFRRPVIERLEDRSLMAITAIFDARAGLLAVRGAEEAENLGISVGPRGEIALVTVDPRDGNQTPVPIIDAATGLPCDDRGGPPCPTAGNTRQIVAALGGNDDVVQLGWIHRPGDMLSTIDVKLGSGNDQFSSRYEELAGVSPEPFAPTLNVSAGQGNDTLLGQIFVHPHEEAGGVSPTPFIVFNQRGGAGNDTLLGQIFVHPQEEAGGVSPQPFIVLNQRGGAGSDSLTAQAEFEAHTEAAAARTDLRGSLSLQVDQHGGGGDDRLLVDGPHAHVMEGELKVGAFGGSGLDAIGIVVPCLIVGIGGSANIVADGGGDDDQVSVDAAEAEIMGGRLDVQVKGGGGDDQLAFSAEGMQVFGGEISAGIDGEAGDDTLATGVVIHPIVLRGFNPQPDPPGAIIDLDVEGGGGDDISSSTVIVHPAVLRGFNPQPDPPHFIVDLGFSAKGGGGNDAMELSASIHPAGAATLAAEAEPSRDFTAPADVFFTVAMDGGQGNDVLDALFGALGARSGRLSVELEGGAGDDLFSLLLSHPPEPILDFVGLINGGKGRDRARISAGVIAKNVEEVSAVR